MDPACPNSIRIIILIEEPIIPLQIPNKKYKVPISLWLVEKSHRIDNDIIIREIMLILSFIVFSFSKFTKLKVQNL